LTLSYNKASIFLALTIFHLEKTVVASYVSLVNGLTFARNFIGQQRVT